MTTTDDGIKITITARAAMDTGTWDDICRLKGLSVYAVNEGRMRSDESITLTPREAKLTGVLDVAVGRAEAKRGDAR